RRKMPFPSFFATPQRNQIADTPCPVTPKPSAERSETATTATTLSAGRVGGRGGDVLDAADLHAGTGQGTEGRLGTGAGGLGAVACSFVSLLSHVWLLACRTARIQNIPPVARILMCRALMPSSLQRVATSWAANMAA